MPERRKRIPRLNGRVRTLRTALRSQRATVDQRRIMTEADRHGATELKPVTTTLLLVKSTEGMYQTKMFTPYRQKCQSAMCRMRASTIRRRVRFQNVMYPATRQTATVRA